MAQKNNDNAFANNGDDWKTPPSPVDLADKIKADKKVADKARKGPGPSATNEVR